MLDHVWQQCVDDFLLHLYDKSSSQGTVDGYRSVLLHFFSTKHPLLVTRRDIEHFLHQGYAPSTRNRKLSIISSFYSYASTYIVSGIAPLFQAPNPTLGITRSKVPRHYRTISYDDLSRLLAVIPSDVRGLRDRAIFSTLWWTARRRSEVARLLYGDIFQGVLLEADGTHREAWLYRFAGKGKAGECKTLELPMYAKKAIDTYLIASGRLATIADDDPLFLPLPSRTGGGLPIDPYKPLSGNAIWCSLKLYAKKAGLDPRKITIHSFRHSSAQARYLAGSDVRAIQIVLDHASLDMTNYYLSGLVGIADPGAKLLEEKYRDLF